MKFDLENERKEMILMMNIPYASPAIVITSKNPVHDLDAPD